MEKDRKIYDLAVFLTGLWMFAMLAVLPLYFQKQYQEIGACKFQIFEWSSVLFVTPAFLCLVWLNARKYGLSIAKRLRSLSSMDGWVLAYAAANLLSYFLSDYPETAWTGVSGWSMGLRTQLFMVGAYFCISRFGIGKKAVWYGHFAASSLVFLLGVLHRFQVDPLGMYEGIDSVYFLQFLSTIGQATWFSSYVCVVLVIGLLGYLTCRRPTEQALLGVYVVLGFMTVVTQNSDSAFAALLFVLAGLLWLALESMERLERFLQLLILMLASFKIIGLLQWGFADRALQLGALSTFFTQGTVTWLLLIAAILAYIGFLLLLGEESEAQKERTVPFALTIRRAIPWTAAAGVAAAVLLIAGNTTGLLERWFGFQSRNQYLLFDRSWGSSRGFNWQFAGKVFAELPAAEKLFGVGPDCFYPYCYGRSDYGTELRQFWGNMNLTNAHNEFLNLLVCVGLVGAAAFVGMLVCAVRRYLKQSGIQPMAAIGALAVLAYGAHNFFCYQQVCCTPFLFLLLGVSEHLVRSGKKDA